MVIEQTQQTTVSEWIDLSDVKVKDLIFRVEEGYLGPVNLHIEHKGKRIGKFYFNMKGFNQDFSLKNNHGVHFGFGGDKSKTVQVAQFKEALLEGFRFLKNYK